MMHMTAHCAHSVHGAMPLHMHIPPIGDVQYVQHQRQTELCVNNPTMSGLGVAKSWALGRTATSRVGGCHG